MVYMGDVFKCRSWKAHLHYSWFGSFVKAGNAEEEAARSSIARGFLLVCFAGLFTYLRNTRIAQFDL